jgi:molybdenum-dependent DNA-binding transcriptional regulator ModE
VDRIEEVLNNVEELRKEVSELKAILNNGSKNELSAKEAAKYMEYSYSHFMNYIKKKLPVSQNAGRGGKVSFKKSDLDAFFDRTRRMTG